MRVNPTNIGSTNTLVHPGFNNFFKWINGKLKVEDFKAPNNPTLFEKTNGVVLNTTKTIWPLYLPLQIIGLFSKRFKKLAKAFYGVCWSIVYTCLRPFAADRKTLGGDNASPALKEAYNLNENFRLGMGTAVSATYGGGAAGMLWGALTGNDDLYDKSEKVYTTGMLNQNQIFGSMNLEKLVSRKLNNSDEQILKIDQEQTGVKEKMEYLDAALFIPNVIARGIDTSKLWGAELSEGTERCINALGKFSYGTWACRFGELKKKKSKEEDGSEYGGDLDPLNPDLEGTAKTIDKALRVTQEKSAKVFQVVLTGLSWFSSLLELLGFHEQSEKVFKLEGTVEKLHPTIAAWCIRNPILNFFKKNKQEIQNKIPICEEQTATQVDNQDEPVILKFVPKPVKILGGDGAQLKVNSDTSGIENSATISFKTTSRLRDEELGYLFEVENQQRDVIVQRPHQVTTLRLKDEEWGGIEALQQAEDDERRRTMIKDEEWGYDLVAKAAQVARKFSGRNSLSEKIAS